MVDTTGAPRLLITTAAVGGGHVSAANAVAQAAAARGLEARVVDALDHVPAAVRAGLPRAFVGLLRHAPGLVEQVGHRLTQDDRRRAAMAAAARAAGRPAAAAELVDDLVAAVWQPQPPAAPVAA